MAAPTLLKLALLCAVARVEAHTIMQRVAVNGVSEPNLVGVRAPFYNDPLFSSAADLNSLDIACGRNHTYPFVADVVNVSAGAEVGTFWWGHVIDVNFDPNQTGYDKPITTDHRGPLIYYLAKVDNAATASSDNLNWFKVGQEALTPPAHWGINSMMDNKGWTYFTLPSCLAPGNYLLRAEALALHQAQYAGEAQFYVSCAQINVVGTGTWKGSNYQRFPGAYNTTDPGILIDIYTWLSTGGGIADNKGRPYVAPGGDVQTCPGATATSSSTVIATTAKTPTSTIAASTTSTIAASTTKTTSTATPTGPSAPLYGQCGGTGWRGATRCASGSCVQSNDYYSQCLP